MPKIIFCIGTLGNGGAERICINLANYFVNDKDYEIFIASNGKGEYSKLLDPRVGLINISGDKSFIRNFFISIKILKETCAHLHPDIVISMLPLMDIKCTILKCCYNLNFKYIHRETNVVFKPQFKTLFSNPLDYITRLIYPISFRKADMIIANSDDTKESIVKCYKINKNKITVLPNPVISYKIIDGLDCIYAKDSEFPKQKFILAVGRLVEQKGFDTLIRAFSEISDKIGNIDLVILGNGPLRDTLLCLCQKLNICNRVHLLKYKSNVYTYYKYCELFALSSRWEGFGNVVVEALAFGKPVVVTNCPGGPHYIINEGQNGIIVPVDDISSLGKAIYDILMGKIVFSPETQKGRARLFSIEKIAEGYKKVILQLLNN